MEQFTANDKKPLFDSDIDPKRIKSVADGLRRQGEFESARMLTAYADLLEAQEKAVPFGYFGWREQKHMDAEGHCTVSRKAFSDLEVTTPVYIHPAFLFRD